MNWWTRPKIVWVPFLIPSWALAQVWGPFILARKKFREYPEAAVVHSLMHEIAHVRQWAQYRFTFPFRYFMAWVQAGFSYEDNHFEREARHMAIIESHKWLALKLYEEYFDA